MKIKTLTFLVIIFFVLIYSRGMASPDFFAQILRDGNYLFNLANKQNSLDTYIPQDLVDLAELGAPKKYIRKKAYEELKTLMHEAERYGISLRIVSAYRSYERQKFIHAFWSSIDKDADMYSAEAGHSEHQLGTTIDFGMGDLEMDLREGFGDTPEGEWLEAHSWKYGFVMSYPREKEDITGYIYEPWHFRFIGTEEAGYLKESGLTLAEYLAAKPQYYTLIRLGSDYKVYKVDTDGTRRWIRTQDVFNRLGYDWHDVVSINRAEFDTYIEGEPVD